MCKRMCEDGMATNLALDDKLLDEALKIGKMKTKKDTVTAALKEFIAKRKQLKIFKLAGTIDYDEDFDYKKSRSR